MSLRGGPKNLDRLAGALRTLGARIRTEGVPEGVAVDCSGRFLRNGDLRIAKSWYPAGVPERSLSSDSK